MSSAPLLGFGVVLAAIAHNDPAGFRLLPGVRFVLMDRCHVSQDRVHNAPGGLVTEDGKVDTITSLIGSKRKENTYPHFTRFTDFLQILVKHPLTHVIPFDPCTLP
jgi:hypothetical protein